MTSEKLPCPFKVGDTVRLVLSSYGGDVGDTGTVTRTRDGVINSEPGAGSCQPRVWVLFRNGTTASMEAYRFERCKN
jgi:hypothetical protein